jgi:regulator of sigma E protease
MNLLIFIGALAAFIILHELGHLVACLVLKIDVEEFGIGFPPRIFTFFRWRGIDFTLNWILLGGFVNPAGQNDPEIAGGLAASAPWKRLVVYFAGPVMNIIVAVLLYTLAVSQMGMPETKKVIVVDVAPNSPAEQAGLKADDLLLRINGQPLEGVNVVQGIVAVNKGKEITLEVQRAGQIIEVKLVPRADPPPGQGAIGIAMSNPTKPISLINAFPLGTMAVVDQGYLLLTLPMKFFQGSVPAEEMRVVGFKGMYDIYQGVRDIEASQKQTRGVGTLAFFAMISASLGILNLMPIPALDGGRILFTLPELLIRRRVPAHLENTLHMVGFMLLLVLLVYVNLQDFINPVNMMTTPVSITPTP